MVRRVHVKKMKLSQKVNTAIRLIRKHRNTRIIFFVIQQKYFLRVNHRELPTLFIPNQFLQSQFASPPSTLRVAITIHLFYPDMSYYFFELLQKVRVGYDLKITVSDKKTKKLVEELSAKLEFANEVDVRIVPNRGRNFAPLLVEFGNELAKNYDVFLHLHSKKSLYTGNNQKVWFEYLTSNLIFDVVRTNEIINLLSSPGNIGIVFPSGYPPFETWVYSWLGNTKYASEIDAKLGLTSDEVTHSGYCDYPVGGMFWARTNAVRDILEAKWEYEDFPPEGGQKDGTLHHAIERYLSVSSIKNGYRAAYTFNGLLSSDPSFSWQNSDLISMANLESRLSTRDTLSWDLFDTLVYRVNGQPDLGKFRVGQVLQENGLIPDAWDYIKIRNKVEEEARKSLGPNQDLSLESITKIIVNKHFQESNLTARELAALEFQFDLEEMRPRPGIVDVYNKLSAKSILISDTYYNQEQVEQILHSLGINNPVKMYISAQTGFRKDRGDVWYELLSKKVIKPKKHLHLGDNELSDNQIPSDIGLTTILIPSAIRAWANQFYRINRSYPSYPTLHEFILSKDVSENCARIQMYFSCPLSSLVNIN
jgi:FMN phosphatase YigB (HAD superfamily)